MRRPVRNSVALLSFLALGIAAGACATAEPVDDDLTGLGQDQSATDPEGSESSKLPPSSSPAPSSSSTTDAGSSSTDAGQQDSSTPPADSGSSNPATDCDPSDPLTLIKLVATKNPTPCPCSASECCYQMAQVCLPK